MATSAENSREEELDVLLTSVEAASLQRAALSLTPPTARRHARLEKLSEVSQTSDGREKGRCAQPP
jgi:predicted ArsR family transcriptional regulator